MNISFIRNLRCPMTMSILELRSPEIVNEKIKSGILVTPCGNYQYQIVDFIPRFVKTDDYTSSFGWQWNKFKKTQFDSNSGLPITSNRFWNATNWANQVNEGEWILDAGCGSGRFAEISTKTKANIVAIDYSSAVEACYENLGDRSNLIVLQCDIYNLPFEDGFFDKIYSLGVLQHTPNVKRAVFCLSSKIKTGGQFCIDFYEKSIKSMFLPKYLLRPITKRMKKEIVFSLLESRVDFLLKMSRLLKKVPFLGRLFARLVPVADYSDILPLSQKQIREWAILDTFDWLTPTYDNPQTKKSLRRWLNEFGFNQIEVLKEGHIVGRGTKI